MDKNELKNLFKVWCVKFDNCGREPMFGDLVGTFIKLSRLEMEDLGIPPDMKTTFIYNVIEKRSVYIGLKLNDYAKALLTCLVNSPGEAVMYLYYLKSKIKSEVNISILDISLVFHKGFPSDSDLSDLWDLQKVGGDNMLDMVDVSDL